MISSEMMNAVVGMMRDAAGAKQPAPTNAAVAKCLGARSTATAVRVLYAAERAGLLWVRRSGTRGRVVGAPDGAWQTAEAAEVASAPQGGAGAQTWARLKAQKAAVAASRPTASFCPLVHPIPAPRDAVAGEPGPGGTAARAVVGCGDMDVSSLDLPPAVATRPAVLSRDERGCRWPLWSDGGKPDHAFCGARRERGSYCAVHAASAFAGCAGAGMPPAAAMGGWRAA